jgi:hypothetical protein
MFGLFKKTAKVSGLPVTLSRRINYLSGVTFLAWMGGDGEPRGLVGYEEFRDKFNEAVLFINKQTERIELLEKRVEILLAKKLEPVKTTSKANPKKKVVKNK